MDVESRRSLRCLAVEKSRSDSADVGGALKNWWANEYRMGNFHLLLNDNAPLFIQLDSFIQSQ
jgi:hypothetical protein